MFFLRCGLSVLVVFGYISSDQAEGQCNKISINIKLILLIFCIYLLFGNFVNLHIFL